MLISILSPYTESVPLQSVVNNRLQVTVSPMSPYNIYQIHRSNVDKVHQVWFLLYTFRPFVRVGIPTFLTFIYIFIIFIFMTCLLSIYIYILSPSLTYKWTIYYNYRNAKPKKEKWKKNYIIIQRENVIRNFLNQDAVNLIYRHYTFRIKYYNSLVPTIVWKKTTKHLFMNLHICMHTVADPGFYFWGGANILS